MVRQESPANARGSIVCAGAGEATRVASARSGESRRTGRTEPPPNDENEPPSGRSNLRGSRSDDDRRPGIAAENPAGDAVVGDAPLDHVRSEPALDREARFGEDPAGGGIVREVDRVDPVEAEPLEAE